MSNTAIWISSLFRGRAMPERSYDIRVTFPMIFHRLTWANSFYCILAIRWCQLPFRHRIFRILPILDNCRYQTRIRNITKFQLLIRKRLKIPLAKLQIDILNLNITLRHCKKIRLLLNKGVYHLRQLWYFRPRAISVTEICLLTQ